MTDFRLDILPDPPDTNASERDPIVVGGDGGTSTTTWVLIGLAAVLIAVAIIALVRHRTRPA